MRERLAAILSERYGPGYRLGDRVSRTVHTVLGPEGPLLFKLHDDRALPRRDKLEALYDAVTRAGFSPGMLQDRDGRLLSQRNGTVYSLHVRVQGANALPPHETLAGRLAALHELLAAKCSGLGLRNHFTTDPKALAKRAESIGRERAASLMREAADRLAADPASPIHGDMHPANVLYDGHRLLFIDFDSATVLPPAAEAVFAGRVFYPDAASRRSFYRSYAAAVGTRVDERQECVWTALHALQRIDFILAEAKRGDRRWMYDLDTQTARLDEALTQAGGAA